MTKVQEYKFYNVDDVKQMLGVKETKAYEIIRELNWKHTKKQRRCYKSSINAASLY